MTFARKTPSSERLLGQFHEPQLRQVDRDLILLIGVEDDQVVGRVGIPEEPAAVFRVGGHVLALLEAKVVLCGPGHRGIEFGDVDVDVVFPFKVLWPGIPSPPMNNTFSTSSGSSTINIGRWKYRVYSKTCRSGSSRSIALWRASSRYSVRTSPSSMTSRVPGRPSGSGRRRRRGGRTPPARARPRRRARARSQRLRPPAAGEGGERERERSSDEKEPEQEPDHVDAERRNEEIRRRTRTDDAADSAERVDVSRRFADPLLLGKFGRVGADKSQQVCRRPEGMSTAGSEAYRAGSGIADAESSSWPLRRPRWRRRPPSRAKSRSFDGSMPFPLVFRPASTPGSARRGRR